MRCPGVRSPRISPILSKAAAIQGRETAVQQVAGEARVGGDSVPGGQLGAPGREAGVEVEGGL